MARARNIKHGLYLNEELAELSIYARYLFPCLWCLADKNGRMEYRPRKIKAEAYPYDDVDIPALLIELHEKKFISVYGNGTRAYIQVNNWDKHQNPHPKEKPSPVPPIDDESSIVASVEFNEEREKQFIFTAESRPDREKPHRTSDSLPSDVMIPDSFKTTTTATHTRSEEIFAAVLEEKEDRIRELFPHADFEAEKETCIAYYKPHPPPADAWVLVLKWFQRVPKGQPFNKGGPPTRRNKGMTAEELKAWEES